MVTEIVISDTIKLLFDTTLIVVKVAKKIIHDTICCNIRNDLPSYAARFSKGS